MTNRFCLCTQLKPAGDQPAAIRKLIAGCRRSANARQTLLGVTGSGKTFTIANVIQALQVPALIIAHNKTLAAQLCNEFREFFPDNAVEYFVSYYDYYQPEAYLPHTDTYIEKETQINAEIDRLRHACTQALLTRRDTIIVASVSAIYGLGSPMEYEKVVLHLTVGQSLRREEILKQLVAMQFERVSGDLRRGCFRLRGSVLELMPVNEEIILRIEASDKIRLIERIDYLTRVVKKTVSDAWIFPARHYVTDVAARDRAVIAIRAELDKQLKKFIDSGKVLEYERLKRRVNYDLEMIHNIGYCNGIENYSRHFEARQAGVPPFTLLDYFKTCSSDFLTVIDESHMTLPQIRGMYQGDKARKDILVTHGFRLPSAHDNRPLRYTEFVARTARVIYVSATPDEYELQASEQVVEQVVRPTGLVDPAVIIQPITGDRTGKVKSQVEDLIVKIEERIRLRERVLVTTLTKKMAEDLNDFLLKRQFKVKYLHSGVDTLERIAVITALRRGEIDVIVGVNLLREGLDMPEVSLVAILDADKEGFLRSTTSLIQTIGRAARNVNGQVVLYADNITGAIRRALAETNRRRKMQLAYNQKHNITPKTIEKNIKNILAEFGITTHKSKNSKTGRVAARDILSLDLSGDARPISEILHEKEIQMRQAAQNLEFELAAILRDEIKELKQNLAS